jgi:hypothetical protein
MTEIRVPEIKKNPGKGAGMREAHCRDKKADWAKKDGFKLDVRGKYPATPIGTGGENIKIPKMFDGNERNRLIWRENILKEQGYDIKMVPHIKKGDPVIANLHKAFYVKTRGDMEKVIRDYPRLQFRVERLK